MSELITIISPVYFEEECIELFYSELVKSVAEIADAEFQFIFVDDGSEDRTRGILNDIAARDDRVTNLFLSRNFGHQIALTAGLDHATGDAVIMMDSDLQHPPSLIPELVRTWRSGYDIVSTLREYSPNETLWKKFSSRLFYSLLNSMSDTSIPYNCADFLLLDRQAYAAIQQFPEKHVFLRGLVSWIGFKRTYVKFVAPDREHGVTKYSLRRMLALAFTALFSFSTTPIRMAYRVGALFLFLGFLYLSYVLLRYAFIGDLVPGWASLICVMLVATGTQLVFLGVIGEYVVRTFEESRKRPLYFLTNRDCKR